MSPHFQPMPLLKRAAPFDDPDWIFGRGCFEIWACRNWCLGWRLRWPLAYPITIGRLRKSCC